MPPLRPCLDCRQPTTGTRCPTCQTTRTNNRNRRRTWYHGTWQTTRRAVLTAWRAEHGNWCPGWNRPAHPATDLTVDHVNPRDPHTLGVLCRACNGSKGARQSP